MVGNIHRKEQKRKENTKAFNLGEIRVTAGDQVSKSPPSDSFSSLPQALNSVAEDSACTPSLPLPSGDRPPHIRENLAIMFLIQELLSGTELRKPEEGETDMTQRRKQKREHQETAMERWWEIIWFPDSNPAITWSYNLSVKPRYFQE